MPMNKQPAPGGIEWTRRVLPSGSVLPGYTWNPIGGCPHECKWTMPDGAVAVCYAKEVAERLATAAYPHGFNHHYWHPERLDEPVKVKAPAGIFLDSMSDLMSPRVPVEQIEAVLDVCRRTPQHTYFLLTKNAPRLLKFKFPANVWVGASSPPDFMFGKKMSLDQRAAMLTRALDVLAKVDVPVTWMSFEPLSWDVSSLVHNFPGSLNWAVIGAASNGAKHFPPAPAHLNRLLAALAVQQVPVFYKGNMDSSPVASAAWRGEFPRGEA